MNITPVACTHPVSQPLLVVVGAGGLDSLDGEVGGEGPADEVGDGGSEAEQIQEDEGDGTKWLVKCPVSSVA